MKKSSRYQSRIFYDEDGKKKQILNRQYKDFLFRMVFREKRDLLMLYNALNETDYQDEKELEIYTMEDVVFLSLKNDVSFLIGGTINLYEHQSTKNPNMPIRGLIYLARNYETYIERNGLDVFSGTLQKLPLPQFVVFYNGEKRDGDRYMLELKDAFINPKGKEACLNCKATVLNINYGHNRELMKSCRRLEEYAIFVAKVRENMQRGMASEDAVLKTIDECIAQNILSDLMRKEKEKVKNFVLSTWGWENHLRVEKEKARNARKTARRKGRAQGRAEEREAVVLKMLKSAKYDDQEILELSGISKERLEKLKEKVSVQMKQ